MNIIARIGNIDALEYDGNFKAISTYVVETDSGRELHVLHADKVVRKYSATTHEFLEEDLLTNEGISKYFLGIPPLHLFV